DGEFGFPQGNMHVTERFTKVDPNTLEYKVTVEDPTIWARPWTIMFPWRSGLRRLPVTNFRSFGDLLRGDAYEDPEDLIEFACHESNYRAIEGGLRAGRMVKDKVESNK